MSDQEAERLRFQEPMNKGFHDAFYVIFVKKSRVESDSVSHSLPVVRQFPGFQVLLRGLLQARCGDKNLKAWLKPSMA